MTPEYAQSYADFSAGMLNWKLWGRLGWSEIKRRYRRTTFGPFWTALSMAIFVIAVSLIWSTLMNSDIVKYLPYLCAGLLIWTFISSTIVESCVVFYAQHDLIKQLQFPYSLLPCAAVWRNSVVFLHNLSVFVVVAIFTGVPITLNTLLVFPGLAIVAINGVWLATLLGLLCARFRDIQQLITSVLPIVLFVTPIFWNIDQLSGLRRLIVLGNPLFHFIEIVRAPLLGQFPMTESYAVVLALSVGGWLVTFDFYSRFRKRIPYWL